VPSIHNRKTRIIMQGELTSPINPKPGCRFMARCAYVSEECEQPQVLEEHTTGHFVMCCKYKQVMN
jgi:peptide/nickel transport system ATP-binding protein